MIRALSIGIAVLFISSFGMLTGAPSHMHHTGCPYAPFSSQDCATLVSHLTHWQSATNATHQLPPIPFLVILLPTLLVAWRVLVVTNTTVRIQARESRQQTLMEMLFSAGILNPKAP